MNVFSPLFVRALSVFALPSSCTSVPWAVLCVELRPAAMSLCLSQQRDSRTPHLDQVHGIWAQCH